MARDRVRSRVFAASPTVGWSAVAVGLAAAAWAAAPAAGATTYVGVTGGTTNWNDPANWNPNVPAEGEDVFIANTTGQNTLTVNDAPHAVGLFTFGDAGARTTAFTVAGTNGLTFNAGFTNTQTTTTGIFLTFATPVTIQGDQTFTVGGAVGSAATDTGVQLSAASSAFTLNGKLTKAGPGQLLFVGRNIGNGDIELTGGSVKLNAGSSALLTVGGTGTITVNTGTILMVARNSGTLNMTKAVTVNTGGTLQVGGNAAVLSDIASPINWAGTTATLTQQTTTANQVTNFTGPWTGAATVTVNANSTATGRAIQLSGDNSAFSGQISAQTVVRLNSDTSPLGTGRFRFDSTAAVLQSADGTPRTIPNVIDVANNSTFGATGTGDLTFTATSSIGIGMGNASKTLTVNNARTVFSGIVTGGPSVNPITKAGPGILEFSGVNTYNRPTSITAGTLVVSGGGRLGAPGNAQPVTVADAGLLDLQVAGLSDAAALTVASTDPTAEINIAAGVNDVVNNLFVNGVAVTPGTYGSTASGAANAGLAATGVTNPDEVFSGAGVLTVLSVPEPGSAGLIGAAAAGLLARRRRHG
jgi:autotransporter-associated beta strand protein